ncbi:MAG: hypothetical protein RL711_1820 [Bacteroidota bacterium]
MKIKKSEYAIIKALYESKFGYGAIGKQLGLKKSTVAKHIQKERLIASIGPKVKLDRSFANGRIPLRIKHFLQDNPTATLGDIKLALDLEVSTHTIGRHLQKIGYERQVAKRRIVISERNRIKRLEFCREMVGKDDAFIESIWFSDETMVKSRPNGEVVFFRSAKNSQWFVPSNEGAAKSVMFWGCVSKAAYGPLVVVEGKNTAARYIETLKEYLLPEIEAAGVMVTFQQDYASIHKTPAVKAFMSENGINTFEWPPQSPDLSPIENLWNAMKMKMKALKPRPKTHANMRDACLEIWTGLEDGLREKLIDSFRERCRRCVAAEGNLIKFVCYFGGWKKTRTP